MKKLFFACFLLSTVCCASQSPEVLHLDEGDDLGLDSHGIPKRYFLISNSHQEGRIGIQNDGQDLKAELECDGPVRSKNLHGRSLTIKANKTAEVFFDQKVGHCSLMIAKDKGIRLIKDELVYPMLKKLQSLRESCQYEPPFGPSIDKLFLTNSYPMLTCAHPASEIEMLSDSENALLTKIEVLLGYKPSADFIRNQNPYADLDFTKAPRLDAIFISTLLYRHDFTGTVLARLLKFHAGKGTLINIIGTEYMQGKKDKALLKELSKFGGNVRIQEYKFHDPRSGFAPFTSALTNHLRDMHVKMFVTLSSREPRNNVLIMGGRNVHDGFVFRERPDFSKYPELDQVDPKAAYAYWNDLEIKVTSPELARSVYAHLLKFWNRSVIGQTTAAIRTNNKSSEVVPANTVLESTTPMIRHIVSLPFNDDHALEKMYVEMIDSASKSVKLSSPYLRPTKAIMDAFERAISRGIEVTIQTRIDLKGDTQAWLYEETNKSAINSLFEKIKIYEWTERSILHTKLMIIDKNVAFFGSVNMSRRSFIQDVENGFLIRDEEFIKRLSVQFKDYNDRSKLITEKQKKKFWASLAVSMLQDQF